MKKIEVKQLSDNFFETIGKEWMLVTAGDENKFNTMTASWGGTGFLWNKPVVFIFIRPERYTFGFLEEKDTFTLSFLGEENRAVHKICGSRSGRDTDKVAQTGLCPVITELGNVMFGQSRLTLECRKLYAGMLDAECFTDKDPLKLWYGGQHGNLHKMYVAEIVNVWVK